MNKDKALQIIKQALDQAIKMGIAPNLETTAIISEAWIYLKKMLVDNGQGTNDN
jgi:hypothetical protein